MIFHKGYKHEQYGKSRGVTAPKTEITSADAGKLYTQVHEQERERLSAVKTLGREILPSGAEAAYLKDGFKGVKDHNEKMERYDAAGYYK